MSEARAARFELLALTPSASHQVKTTSSRQEAKKTTFPKTGSCVANHVRLTCTCTELRLPAMIIDILTQGRMSSPTFTPLQNQHALCHEHRKPLPRLSQGAGRDQRIPYDVLAGRREKLSAIHVATHKLSPKRRKVQTLKRENT